MDAADKLLSETYSTFLKNWTVIESLRKVATVALPIATQQLTAQNAALIEIMSKDPDYKKIIVNKEGSATEWGDKVKSILSAGLTNLPLTLFTTAIDAASIVFAQSILDDAVLTFLRVCGLVAPSDWEKYIDARKVDFATIKSKDATTIREELVTANINQLGMESLLKKLDVLFALAPPPPDFKPIEGYKYDRDRIEKIDKLRQSIIHHNAIGTALLGVEEDLTYVKRTINYLIALINKKYGVRLDMAIMFPAAMMASTSP